MFPLVSCPYLRRPLVPWLVIKSRWTTTKISTHASRDRHDRRTRCRGLGTPNWSWPCGVHRGSQRHRRISRTNGQTVWDASGSLSPPQPSSSHLHHPFYRGSPHAGQPASSPGSGETRETDAQSFLHPAIAATQLSNCQKSAYPLCVWHLGTG